MFSEKIFLTRAQKANSHFESDSISIFPDSKRSNLAFDFAFLFSLPKSKTSQSHVEMILSFVLFAGFLIFVFFMINPLFRVKENLSIENEKTVVMEEISAVVGKIPVSVENDDYCYSIDKIKNSYGDKFIEMKDSVADVKKQVRYVLYFGDFMTTQGTISCSDRVSLNQKGDDAFRFGSYTEETFIFKPHVIGLKQAYETDYTLLIKNLGIGNFAFSFQKLDGSVVSELSISEDKIVIPQNVPVVSVAIPVIVIDDTLTKEELILIIKKW